MKSLNWAFLKVQYGISRSQLYQCVDTSTTGPDTPAKAAYAHIKNAFSMLNIDGSDANIASLTKFRGCFTPEFYPKVLTKYY